MFGFFNNNRPGPGISKEQAARRNYFDIYGRHFGHITGLNLLYVLTNIIFFIAAAVLFRAYFIGENGDNLVYVVSCILTGKNFIVPILPFVPFMLIGPFTAGYTYVIRNYTKQEPTFLVSEYFEHTKKNFKQSLIISVLSVFVAYVLIQAFVFYNSMFITNGLPVGAFYTLFAIVFALYLIMMYYIYPIMVTFKMDLKVILKNAWTFTILKLPQNVIILVFLLAVNLGLAYLMCFVAYLPSIFYFIVLAIFLTGFTAFTANYYIWHVLDKYIVTYVKPKRESQAVFNDDEYPELNDEYDMEAIVEDEYLL